MECKFKLLDHFGFIRLCSGDLFTTFEGPNQNHNCGGYFVMKKVAFEEFRQTVYKKFILNIRKASMVQIVKFGFKLWKDIDKEVTINQVIEWKESFKTKYELLEYINNLWNEDMDYTKPLWEFRFVENYTNDSSIIIVRYHHSFCDGIGFATILSCLNDNQFSHKIDKKSSSISLMQKAILVLLTPFYIVYSMIVTSKIESDPKAACINELNYFLIELNVFHYSICIFILNKFSYYFLN